MELKLTFGEILTIGAVVFNGVAMFVKFDRRMTIMEERVKVLSKGCPILHKLVDDEAEG